MRTKLKLIPGGKIMSTATNAQILNSAPQSFTVEDIETLKRHFVPEGMTDEELRIYVSVCKKTGLDPFTRQIYVTRKVDKHGHARVTYQATIDGFRLIAQRSGEYEGQVGPFWCGKAGIWKDVWVHEDLPFAAKVGTIRKGFRDPIMSVAHFRSYAQFFPDGNLNHMWQRSPELMIGKCAEALSLRRAFPNELSGIYSSEEISENALDDIEQPKSIQRSGPVLPPPAQPPIQKALTDKQIDRMYAIAHHNGVNIAAVSQHIHQTFGKTSIATLTRDEYDSVCHALDEGYFQARQMEAAINSARATSLGEGKQKIIKPNYSYQSDYRGNTGSI